jgi:hypothetical protein
MSEKYDAMRQPPAYALRQITAGRLKNKTDINPQWRYEIMDKTYGPCGTGWKYEIIKLWTEAAPAGQVMCFSEIKVYTNSVDGWSDPIPGIGGSMLVEQETKGIHVSDEGYKMATTDALSVALKMLGVGADIYAGLWDGEKYKDTVDGSGSDDDKEYEKELKEATLKLEKYLSSGIVSGENKDKAQRAIDTGNLENILKWNAWAKKQEEGK